jgi:hypothetical protein
VADSWAQYWSLGSVTKQFTAAAILLLEDREKLKIEDRVGKYLPDAPTAWTDVTIFHLLTHTSGIPDFTALPEYRSIEPLAITAEKLIGPFRDQPLDFPPGSKLKYSNSGYAVLGMIVEKVSGENYAKFIHDTRRLQPSATPERLGPKSRLPGKNCAGVRNTFLTLVCKCLSLQRVPGWQAHC